MHRIDGPGSVDGQFSAGNPATNTPATTVTPEWANDLQNNVAAVVEAAGIPLVKGEATQLTAAIQALFAAYLSSMISVLSCVTDANVTVPAMAVGEIKFITRVATGGGLYSLTAPATGNYRLLSANGLSGGPAIGLGFGGGSVITNALATAYQVVLHRYS